MRPPFSTTTRILLALALAGVIGLGLAWASPETGARVAGIAQPIGKLWLNALQMTVVPLVGTLVVLGVAAARDAAASGRIARRAIVIFLVLLAFSASFAALAAPAFLSFMPHSPELMEALKGAAGTPLASEPPKAADWLTGIVPSNAIAAAAASAMLPLVVFSLFFGFALTRIDELRRERLLELVQAIADVMIVIVRWVLAVAPLGVFALVLAVTAQAGAATLQALGIYIALVCVLYLAVTALLYPLVRAWTGRPLGQFATAIFPAQAVAMSTQSSLASLPAMIDVSQRRLGIPLPTVSLVLPMAVSLFRLTSPVQYVAVAAFVAWAYGIDIGPLQWATAVPLAVVVSLGAIGLPGQVSFMATNMPVTQALGLPVDPLGLLLAVDTIPDVFATLGNVTADVSATAMTERGPSAQAPASPLAPSPRDG
ncbi:dicarboxylate/amino acid:cation symporter [Lysobacter pythonis]|uniref:Dicarboxylate/amino acid:cation symporter n=1 Tax=Solilutibacter pythonis TaxID=2483112 RepID=A0A3M2HR92_9GAMM|nr:cation:dicarboxylase symporter family transporter [Lysobacter pythonis]RMH90855.1 dicarboxylate/amino acid:cation symporter [Lysobacter pythonis]